MTAVFDAAARERLESYLATHELSVGVGSEKSACSIAAINLALSGRLDDYTPECSSPVACAWVVQVQDAMPAHIRNSSRWKAALVRLAGCGRDPEHERRRLSVITDWMWGVVLPRLQGIADAQGFGEEWRAMCEQKTYATADAARAADRVAACAAACAAADAARVAACAAAKAAYAAAEAAFAAAYAAARAAAWDAAGDTTRAAACAAAYAAVDDAAWDACDPCSGLEALVE